MLIKTIVKFVQNTLHFALDPNPFPYDPALAAGGQVRAVRGGQANDREKRLPGAVDPGTAPAAHSGQTSPTETQVTVTVSQK